jgi:N-acetylmuramoyl-L-alanine amidase
MNKYSIGIELVDVGKVIKSGNNWIFPVDKKAVQDSDVIIARHKNKKAVSGWQMYLEIQLQTAIEIGAALVKMYNLKDVVGHDDIAPHRKSDPGPAFQMGSFRSKIMGRKENSGVIYNTSNTINILSGSVTQFAPIT